MDSLPMKIDKHPPERRRGVLVTMSCGGCSTCCCCCCCCLHSVGSLLGSAIAPAIGGAAPALYETDHETGKRDPVIARPGLSAVAMFWIIQFGLLLGLIVLSVVASLRTSLMANGVPDEMLLVGPFVLFVFLVCALPCYQVFCLIVTVAIYAIWPRLDRGYQLIQLAKIGGGIVVGTVAGLLAMLLLIVPFVVLR